VFSQLSPLLINYDAKAWAKVNFEDFISEHLTQTLRQFAIEFRWRVN